MSAGLPYRRARPFALVFELVKQPNEFAHPPYCVALGCGNNGVGTTQSELVGWPDLFVLKRRGCGVKA